MLTIKERINLRKNILQELYIHNFEARGVAIKSTIDEIDKDVERSLAYDYLKDKGLIKAESGGGRSIKIKITALGIDLVESLDQK
ncbi:hypothetical protein CN689_14245 [Peribacillus butanolivorans]|uniref:Uncharacterized protein n=1 Tax=Peribacillus butanolivorans TaxID=421767 RepID=A0AAX0S499_9BACI|nr:hypothetical protein [Peribacillus butanolivorans]PEJ32286.1 hypothetical protein CN689_14245 [Peribacillus butanolivorans]